MPRRKTRRLRGGDPTPLNDIKARVSRLEEATRRYLSYRRRYTPPEVVSELKYAYRGVEYILRGDLSWVGPENTEIYKWVRRAFAARSETQRVLHIVRSEINLSDIGDEPETPPQTAPICGLRHIPEPFRQNMVSLEDIPEGTLMTEYKHMEGETIGHIPSEIYESVYSKRDQTGRHVGQRVREYKGRGRRRKTRRKSRK